jgi:ElaB/YqjD/DUF883 family membrane-anchored ribosome-binding protein
MAKTNANDTPNEGPPAEPTSAADPTSPPDASTEPAAQVAATMATEPGGTARSERPVLPPAPADYEMPDDYETDWLGQTRRWVEENPVLAIAAAAGVGLVVGRLVMALLPEPEPPPFSARVEKRARQLRKDAAVFADDAGEVLSDRLKKAANALSDAAEVVADKAETGYERSKDLAEVVGDAVTAAVTGLVAKKADGWLSRLRS